MKNKNDFLPDEIFIFLFNKFGETTITNFDLRWYWLLIQVLN